MDVSCWSWCFHSHGPPLKQRAALSWWLPAQQVPQQQRHRGYGGPASVVVGAVVSQGLVLFESPVWRQQAKVRLFCSCCYGKDPLSWGIQKDANSCRWNQSFAELKWNQVLTCTSNQPNRQHTQGPSPPELWLQFRRVFQWKLKKEKHVNGMTQLSGESPDLFPGL